MNFLKNLICGACIGIAEAIPGVSGGTVAVLLKIYDELIGSISKLRQQFKKSLVFLVPIVLGMGLGLFGFSHIITYLLEHFPMAVNFFFVGLIIGLVPMLLRRSLDGGFRVSAFWPFVVMLAVMAALAFPSRRFGRIRRFGYADGFSHRDPFLLLRHHRGGVYDSPGDQRLNDDGDFRRLRFRHYGGQYAEYSGADSGRAWRGGRYPVRSKAGGLFPPPFPAGDLLCDSRPCPWFAVFPFSRKLPLSSQRRRALPHW